MERIGYWNDWTGAFHKVQILDETVSGNFVYKLCSGEIGGLSVPLIPKKKVKLKEVGWNTR